MKVILSKYAGFCYGVNRAIKIANKSLLEHSQEDIFMLGELVHNENVIKKLKEQNIKLIKDIQKIPLGAWVILSAHGHSPFVYEQAEKRNLKVIDATCPKVIKVHQLGKMLAKQGYFIIIIGDKIHSEVRAIFDQVKSITDKVKIVENIEQAKKMKKIPRIGVISQTTQSLSDFEEIVAELANRADELRIFNTICDATRFRQLSAKKLAKEVDIMIIVGSFYSANTKRLANICGEIVKTYQVESAQQLDKKWFKNKRIVGVSAGASTPDWIIKDIVREIKK